MRTLVPVTLLRTILSTSDKPLIILAKENNCTRRVEYAHFVPAPDYLSLEAEGGTMRGHEALYDFSDGVFREGFSNKGYATLSPSNVNDWSV